MNTPYRLSADLLDLFDFQLTPEQKYLNIPTQIFCNSHGTRKVILYPNGWHGMELVEDYQMGQGFMQVFRGAVDNEEEFRLVLRMVGWINRQQQVSGVEYLRAGLNT